jgi:hypothetical protein
MPSTPATDVIIRFMSSDPLTHSPRHLSGPEGWVFYLSHSQPERLIVFVRGFRGGVLKTWQHVPRVS